ncbi:putative membrane protein [Bradyrhizobium sp. AZCC 1719]|uniref:anthrone oxygenase family protein n=1 Tax=Bradyrhizobium sp. AZCC 1719 TaxID=3117028 RepID=UPI002FF21976
MLQMLITALLWFCALGCGLLAGLYFAFSTFIMAALGRIGQASGIAAMNAINVTIVQSLFMPIFLGTTAASAALAVTALLRWSEPGAMAMLAGGMLYVLGMFVVTMVFNVPLNNALAAADPASHEAASLWARYLTDWTRWNHVRTVASTAACALFIAAIAAK